MPREGSVLRGAIAAGALGIAGLFAFFSAQHAAQMRALASADPVAAVAQDNTNPEALVRLAESPQAPAAARALLEHAVQAAPARAPVLAALARSYASSMDRTRATILMTLAAQLDAGELKAQIFLLNTAYAARDYDAAVLRFDRLGRLGMLSRVMADYTPFFANPDLSAALARAMAAAPPWREELIGLVAWFARTTAPLSTLSDASAKAGITLTAAETNAILDGFVRLNATGEAYARWLGALPIEALAQVTTLTNGRFERQPDGSPFDWRFDLSGGDITLSDMSPPGPEGRMACAYLVRKRHSADIARQYLVLPAGRWRLSAQLRPSQFDASRGAGLTLACERGAVLGETQAMKGTGPWRRIETEFFVPDDQTCPVQTLSLNVIARVPSEREASGTVCAADIRLERINPAP